MNIANKKKTILIDLDGVLNNYVGIFDKDFVPPIKKGAKEFLEKLSNDFEIKLFTTRNKILAAKWVEENSLTGIVSDITNVKELCWLFIDDRCICFDGNYDLLCKKILEFKPYYKL